MSKKKILFVCLGNICRSPAAEGVMKSLIAKGGLENFIEVDSAGTIGYHEGEGADPRMKKYAAKRGYDLTSISRKFERNIDFEEFDYIVVMDDDNYDEIKRQDFRNLYSDKLYKIASFSSHSTVSEVPDPYYLGQDGFENVLDILEDACNNLLRKVKDDIKSENKINN